MVRSSFSTRSIANHYNDLGKSDPNPTPELEREDEDSLAGYSTLRACNANDSGAESIILGSDDDDDEYEYGEEYSG